MAGWLYLPLDVVATQTGINTIRCVNLFNNLIRVVPGTASSALDTEIQDVAEVHNVRQNIGELAYSCQIVY